MLKTIFRCGFLILLLSNYAVLKSQTIENFRFVQEGKQIHIYYDLISDSSSQNYEVHVFLSSDGGKSLKGPLKKLSGDHEKGVRPGTGKKITWDVLEEVEKLTGEVLFELSVMPEGAGESADESASAACVDVNGNTYRTVKLGRQVWMAENLKVTHYPDGLAIPLETQNGYWKRLRNNNEDDAYYFYNNNSRSKHGALYTYAAALNACPAGWHLPSDAEWTELENYLAENSYNYDGTKGGGRDKIAKAMAASSGWSSSSKTGVVGNKDYPEKRNASGFSALPGGFRNCDDGVFYLKGFIGYWWSSTESSTDYAWNRYMNYDNSSVAKGNHNKKFGLSVRCVRDN